MESVLSESGIKRFKKQMTQKRLDETENRLINFYIQKAVTARVGVSLPGANVKYTVWVVLKELFGDKEDERKQKYREIEQRCKTKASSILREIADELENEEEGDRLT